MKYIVFVVLIALVACAAYATETPAPMYMSGRALGGGALNQFTPGVAGGTGANNIGLLVRTYGQVTYVDSANKYFYIDDGCARADGTKRPDNSIVLGIRVSYGDLASGLVINPPAVGARVSVTGVISTCMVGGLVQPNLRARHQDDIL